MIERLFFVSHSLGHLVQAISEQIAIEPFAKNLVITPSKTVSEWLKIELCKKLNRKALIGLECLEWRSAIKQMVGSAAWIDRMQLVAELWPKLDGPAYRRWKTVNRLAALFLEYYFEGFQPSGSQGELFQTWFPTSLADLLSNTPIEHRRLYLFGIDALPKTVEEFFWRHPHIHEYRFAPSAMFWQDLQSPKEKNRWVEKLKKQGKKTDALEASFQEDHSLLSMWGTLGKKRIELAGDVLEDDFFQISDSCKAALHQLQEELLFLENRPDKLSDSSIEILQAGASRLREIELAKEKILRAASNGTRFSEIGLYVTNMQVYEPLIEYVFSDPDQPIPHRIEGSKSYCKSEYYQGVISLFQCLETRWAADAVCELFKNRCLKRRVEWTEEDNAFLVEWVRLSGIRWALDEHERGKPEGSWEYGIGKVAESLISFFPEQEKVVSWSQFDSLDRFTQILDRLKASLSNLRIESHSLSHWGLKLEGVFDEFFRSYDEDQEGVEVIQSFISFLKQNLSSETYPFLFVRRLFDQFEKKRSGGSVLHGVHCAELPVEGALPADVVIVVGLDEESHPRKRQYDLLDLRPYSNLRDQDRYSFLKTVFAAKKELCFIYRNASEEDGKEMSPSIVLQELIDYFNLKPIKPPIWVKPASKGLLQSAVMSRCDIEGEVLLEEMVAFFRNPIEFYLQRVAGIDLKEQVRSAWSEFELNSFQWAKLLKTSVCKQTVASIDGWPLGVFGEEAKERFLFQLEEYRRTLQDANIDPSTIESVPIRFDGVVGDAHGAIAQGALYFSTDHISGYLRRWPELLAILAQTGTNQIVPLKGKNPRIVKDPQAAFAKLKQFFIQHRFSLVPMHPEWIDGALRKQSSIEPPFEDRVLKWAIDRSPAWNPDAELKNWEKELREVFSPLLELFPARKGADAEI